MLAADIQGDGTQSAQVVTLTPGTPESISATIGDGYYGLKDVDLFEIYLQAGDDFVADIDAYTNGSSLNSYLRLFDTYPYQVAVNNDDPSSPLDSLLTYTAANSGTYYLGVSSVGNTSYYPSYAGYASYGSTTGDYELTLLIDDGSGGVSNTPPDSSSDSYSVGIGTGPLIVAGAGVLANDTDADGDTLTASIDSTPVYGTLTEFNADGSFTYTPDPNFSGTDSFTYLANDGDQNSDPTTVFITVVPAAVLNQVPIAVYDTFEINLDTRRIVAAPGLLQNDTDPDDDSLFAELVTPPSYGALLSFSADGSFEYQPDTSFTGTDSFTYRVNDGTDESVTATVNLIVSDQGFREDLIIEEPAAKNDHFIVHRDSALSVASPGYLENDARTDGDIATTQILAPPRFGTLTLGALRGEFDYVPFPGFVGTDSFRYQVTNEAGQSNPVTVELEVIEPPTVLDLESKPNVIVVNALADGVSSSYMTLREAVEAASLNGPSLDIIEYQGPDGDFLVYDNLGPIVIDSEIEFRFPNRTQVIRAHNNHETPLLHVTSTGIATFQNFTFSGGINNAGNGGAIINEGVLTLENTHVTDSVSTAGDGGGIFNAAGATLNLIQSTVSNNSAYSDGGGIFNAAGATLLLNSSTVSTNQAGLWGGGIYNSGSGTIAASTVALNQSSTGSNIAAVESLDLSNSIVALGVDSPDIDGAVSSLGGNLIGSDSGTYSYDVTDQIGDLASPLDPLLGALQFNGGTTPTHMLLTGSPAIDAGTTIHRFQDQRGADRMLDGLDPSNLTDSQKQVDIGAVEFGTFFANVLEDGTDTTPLGDGRVDIDPATPGDQVSLRAAIQELNALAGAGNTAAAGAGVFEAAVAFDHFSYQTLELELAGGNEDLAVVGDLDVHGNLSIHGDLSDSLLPWTKIDGGWRDGNAFNVYQQSDMEDRIFHVHPGATLNASTIKITGGRMDYDYGFGGAILNDQATVLLSDVSIVANVAQRGGAIANLDGMTVISGDSDISYSFAGLGGGVYVDGGSVTVDDSEFRDNAILIGGAAFYIDDGELLITNNSNVTWGSILYGFDDPQGMAVFAAGGVVDVTDGSTFKINGYEIGDNYASGNLGADYLLPDPAHRTASTAQYLPRAVVFVTEDAEFNLIESSIRDQFQYINIPGGGAQLTQGTIPIINLGRTYTKNAEFLTNDLTLANFQSGTAVIEGGEIRDVGGHYNFGGAGNYESWSTFDYATSNITDVPIQNHNGDLTLLGVTMTDLNRINYLSDAVANYGIQAEMNIIGTRIEGGSIRNQNGNLNLHDSFLHGGEYLWYDSDPYAVIQHNAWGQHISQVTAVSELILDQPLQDYERQIVVQDAGPITQFDLPCNIVVNEERMIVTDVDSDTDTLTVSRPHPQYHAVGSKVLLRNEFVDQIPVDSVEEFARYDLPLDIYMAVSTGTLTHQNQGESRYPGTVFESDASQVEAMTVTSIDYERGLLNVMRGRYGTTPARFTDDLSTTHQDVWLMPGQMRISGTTFTDNTVDIGPYWLNADSSVSLVRSTVSEFAPPLVIENSTFSNNRSNGPVAALFAERTSLTSVVSYHTISYEMILVDGADESYVVEPNSEIAPPVIVENTIFADSTSLIDGTPIADATILQAAGQHQNFIELMTRDTTDVRYIDLSDDPSTQRDVILANIPPLEADLDNRPKRITLDGGSQTEFLAPSTPLSDGYLGDGWLLNFDPELDEQPRAQYSHYGVDPATYSIAAVFRNESQGAIAFRVNNVESELELTSELVSPVSAVDTQITIERFTVHAGEYLRLGDEELLVTAITENVDGTLTLDVVRGAKSTASAAHDPNNSGTDNRVIRSDFLFFDEFSNQEFVTLLEDYEFDDRDEGGEGKIEVEIWSADASSAVVADAIQIREKLIGAPGQSTSKLIVTETELGTVPAGAHVDFGTTPVGTSVTMNFEVLNDSEYTYFIDAITPPAGFTVSGELAADLAIEPNETLEFSLTLDADEISQSHGILRIDYGINQSIEFVVSGVATIQNAVQYFDSQSSYFTGDGLSFAGGSGYAGSYYYANSSGDKSGRWAIDVDEGTYRVAATWPTLGGQSADTPYTLYDEVDVYSPYWSSANAPAPTLPDYSAVPTSYFDPGDLVMASGESTSVGNQQPYTNADNVALGATITASNSDSSAPHLYHPDFLTDGNYGNGASFKSSAAGVQLTLDLGTQQSIDAVLLGRDRTGALNDLQFSDFTISVSTDGFNYTQVFDSASISNPDLSLGSLPAGESVEARFTAASAQYVLIDVDAYGSVVVIDEIEVLAADNDSPMITAVIVGSGDPSNNADGWSDAFIDSVDGGGAGAGNGIGFDVLAGGSVVPWNDVDRVYVQFSEDVVDVTAADIALIGSAVDHSGVMTVSYDPLTFTAILELPGALGVDELRLTINETLIDVMGNLIDGDAQAGAGGVFDFRFDVLPADADGDGVVDGDDLTVHSAAAGTQTGDASYDAFADWNADGNVDSSDLSLHSTYSGTDLTTVVDPRELDPDTPIPDANDIILDNEILDQSIAPNHLYDGYARWHSFGQYTISTDLHDNGSTTEATLLVEMTNDTSGGNAVADAIRLQRVADISVTESDLTVIPDAHVGFGVTPAGTAVEKTYTITNISSGDYFMRAIVAPGGFSIVNNITDGQVLPAGQSLDFTVRLDADRPLKAYGQLSIVMDTSAGGDITQTKHLYQFNISGTSLDPWGAQDVQIIDNSDPGAGFVGDFETVSDGFRERMWRAPVNSIEDRAFWIVDVEPGTYEISATWAALSGNSSAAPFTIYDGVTGVALGTTTVNQRELPSSYGENHVAWSDLGTFTTTGNTILVELPATGSNRVVADAIRVQRSAHIADIYLTDELSEIVNDGQLVGMGLVELDENNIEATFTLHNDSVTDYTLAPIVPPEGFTIIDNFLPGQVLTAGSSVDFTIHLNTDRINKSFGAIELKLNDGSLVDTLYELKVSGTVVADLDGGQVIDNLDDGVDWVGDFEPSSVVYDADLGNDDSLLSSLGASDTGEKSAASWHVDIVPGTYLVDITWATNGNASNTPITIHEGPENQIIVTDFTVNQSSVPLNNDDEPIMWHSLAEIIVTGDWLTFTMDNTVGASNRVEFDAIRIRPTQLPEAPARATKVSSDFFRIHAFPGIKPVTTQVQTDFVRWDFEEVPSGTYKILTNFDGTDDGRLVIDPDTQSEYRIDDPLSIRQYYDNGADILWFEVGEVTIDSDNLSVEIHHPAYAQGQSPDILLITPEQLQTVDVQLPALAANAIETHQSRHIIDNTDAGYQTSSAVNNIEHAYGFAGDRDVIPAGTTATWQFENLVPGTYLVASVLDPSLDTSMPFTIRDSTGVLSGGTVDYLSGNQTVSRTYSQRMFGGIQELAYGQETSTTILTDSQAQDFRKTTFFDVGYQQDGFSGETIGQYDWIVLDRIVITGSELTVDFAGGSNVYGDAIRIERFRGAEADLGRPADLGGLTASQSPNSNSPVIDQGNDTLFKGINTEVSRDITDQYTDGWLFVDDLTPFIRTESNLNAPFFPYPIQVGRETMLAMGYDSLHSALIVERGHNSTVPLTHTAGEKVLYGFAGRSTTLAQHLEDPSATVIRVDWMPALPTTRQFDIRLGREEMTVTDVVDNGDGTYSFKVIRGVHGTTPESVLPVDTHVLLLTDQSGGNRFFDGNGLLTRSVDYGAVEAVYIDVSGTTDLVDSNPGDGYAATSVAGTVSLRAAVNEANAIGGFATINLPAGTHTLSLTDPADGSDDEFFGDLDIYGYIHIIGSGADQTTIDADDLDRVFHVHPGARLILEGVTLTGGLADQGGAILVSSGSLNLVRSVVTANQAVSGAGISVTEDGFAGILMSTVHANTATLDGGGINVSAGEIDVFESTISGNVAASGAGIFLETDATASIDSSTIVRNQSDFVSGIHSLGTTTIAHSVVAENTNAGETPYVDLYGRFASDGYNFVGVAQERSTLVYDFDRNTYADTYTITVTDPFDLPAAPFDILVGDEVMQVAGISGNVLHINTDVTPVTSLPTVAVGDEILFDGFWQVSDRLGSVARAADPKLGDLADNGGTTPTHLPDVDSPLVDAGPRPEGSIHLYDQRGRDRYFDDDQNSRMERDIGSVERDADWVTIDSTTLVMVETETAGQTYEFKVTRSMAADELTVFYAVRGSGPYAATESDFVGGVLPTGSVTFAPGQYEQTITVDVSGDDIVEADQEFEVVLKYASPLTIMQNRIATGVIRNDDSADVFVQPAFFVEGTPPTDPDPYLDDEGNIAGGDRPYEAIETTPAGATITFTVELDNDVEGGFEIDYATELLELLDGYASGNDFWETSGSLSFAGTKGEQQFVTVTIREDATVELDEEFGLALGSVNNTSTTQAQSLRASGGTGTIVNDDEFTITVDNVQTWEANGSSISIGYVVLSANVDRTVTGNVVGGSPFVFSGGKGESFVFYSMSSGPFSIDNVSAVGREESYVSSGMSAGGGGEGEYAMPAWFFEDDEPYQGLAAAGTGEGEDPYGGGGGSGGSGSGGDPYGGGGGGGGGGDPGYVPFDVDYDGIPDPPVFTVWGSQNEWDLTKPVIKPYPLGYGQSWCDPSNPDAVDTKGRAQDLLKMSTYEAIVSALVGTMDGLPIATEHDQHLEFTAPWHALASVANNLWGEVLSIDYMVHYEGCRISNMPLAPPEDPEDPIPEPPPEDTDPVNVNEYGTPVSSDNFWVTHESQALESGEEFQSGLEVLDYQVSHRSELTFNPIASYAIPDDIRLSSAPAVSLIVSDQAFPAPDVNAEFNSVAGQFGTLIVNSDFTLTYTPKNDVSSKLEPRLNPQGEVYQYDGIDTFKVAIELEGGVDEQGQPDPRYLNEIEIQVMVTDSLPVLIGDRIHSPDPGTGRMYLDAPLYVDFESTMRIDINDLFIDPDNAYHPDEPDKQDKLEIQTIAFENSTAQMTDDGILNFWIGDVVAQTYNDVNPSFQSGIFNDTRGIANTASASSQNAKDERRLFAKLVDASESVDDQDPDIPETRKGSIVDIYNELYEGDVNSTMASETLWDPASQPIKLQLVVTDGSRTDEDGKPVARVLEFEVVPRGNDPDGWIEAKAQPTRSFDQIVTPTLPQRDPSQQTDWKVEAVYAGENRSFESVGGTAVDLVTGTFLVDHGLILDGSGGMSELALPGLIYDSSTVHVAGKQTPVIQAEITKPESLTAPSSITATLTWYDHTQPGATREQIFGLETSGPETTFNLDWTDNKGVIALQSPVAPTKTGLYSWKLEVDFGDTTITNHGQSAIVVNQGDDAIFGDGWALAGVPTLTLDRHDSADSEGRFYNPDGFDDRVILSFPGSEPILFDYSPMTILDPKFEFVSELVTMASLSDPSDPVTRDGYTTVLPSIQNGSKTTGYNRGGFADVQEYGTLTARQIDDWDFPEDSVDNKPDELVYKAPDGTEYVFYRWEIEGETQFLLNRIEQPGIDFDPDVNPYETESASTERRGVSLKRVDDENSSNYGRLDEIHSSDGAISKLVFSGGDYVDRIELTGTSESGLSQTRKVEFTIDTGSNLTQIEHVNAAPLDYPTLTPENQIRNFDYNQSLMTTNQWLDSSNAIVRHTEYAYEHRHLGTSAVKTGLSQIQRGDGTGAPFLPGLDENVITFEIIPSVIVALQTSESDRTTANLVELTSEVINDPRYLDYPSQDILSGQNITKVIHGVSGLPLKREEYFGQRGQLGDPLRVTESQYTSLGDLSRFIDELGRVTEYRYDYQIPASIIVGQSDNPAGQDGYYVYDSNDYRGNVTHTTTPGTLTLAHYETDDEELDAVGKLVESMIVSGAVNYLAKTYKYEKDGRIKEITGGNGYKETWEYHAPNEQLHRYIDANQLETLYMTYFNGNVWESAVTDDYGDGLTVFTTNEYDPLGYLDKVVTDSTVTISTEDFDFDVNGNLSRHQLKDKDDVILIEHEYEYAADGRQIKRTDADGVDFTTRIDKAGLVTQTIDAVGATYTSKFLPNSYTIEQKTIYSYYGDGTVFQTTAPDNSATTQFVKPNDFTTWTLQSNVAGNSTISSAGVLTKELTKEQVVKTIVDKYGRIKIQENQLTGAKTTFDYLDNRVDQPTSTATDYVESEDASAKKQSETKVSYDAFGNALSVTDPVGLTSTSEYNTLLQLEMTKVQTERGAEHNFTYTAGGQIKTVAETRSAEGSSLNSTYTTTYWYDESGRLRRTTAPISETDAVDATTDYKYEDGLLRIESNSRINAKTTRWINGAGQTVMELSPLLGVRRWIYDDKGRLEEQYTATLVDGVTVSATDTYQQIIGKLGGKRLNTYFDYDALGRVRKSTSGMTTPATTFTDYFLPSDTNFNWDVAITDEHGETSAVLLDSLGQTVVTLSANTATDTNDQYTRALQVNGYQYNFGTGLVTSTTTVTAATLSGDTPAGRPNYGDMRKSVIVSSMTGSALRSEADNGGNATQVVKSKYDALGRAVESTRFAYGSQDVTTTYTYDDNKTGTQQIRSQKTSNDGAQHFRYDSAGNAVAIADHSSFSPASSTTLQEREYDALGRITKIETTIDQVGTNGLPNGGTEKIEEKWTYEGPVTKHSKGASDQPSSPVAESTLTITFGTNPTKTEVGTYTDHHGLRTQTTTTYLNSDGSVKKIASSVPDSSVAEDQTRDSLIEYAYDDRGRLIRDKQSGKIGEWTFPKFSLEYSYEDGQSPNTDKVVRKFGSQNKRFSETVVTYDGVGNISSLSNYINSNNDGHQADGLYPEYLWRRNEPGHDKYATFKYDVTGNIKQVVRYNGDDDQGTRVGVSIFAYRNDGLVKDIDHFEGDWTSKIATHNTLYTDGGFATQRQNHLKFSATTSFSTEVHNYITNADGRISSSEITVIDPTSTSQTETTTIDKFGHPASSQPQVGRNGWLYEETLADGTKRRHEYDDAGHLKKTVHSKTKLISPWGDPPHTETTTTTTENFYDHRGRIVQSVTTINIQEYLTGTALGDPHVKTRVIEQVYDGLGRKMGRSETVTDSESVTPLDNVTIAYGYDRFGKSVEIIATGNDVTDEAWIYRHYFTGPAGPLALDQAQPIGTDEPTRTVWLYADSVGTVMTYDADGKRFFRGAKSVGGDVDANSLTQSPVIVSGFINEVSERNLGSILSPQGESTGFFQNAWDAFTYEVDVSQQYQDGHYWKAGIYGTGQVMLAGAGIGLGVAFGATAATGVAVWAGFAQGTAATIGTVASVTGAGLGVASSVYTNSAGNPDAGFTSTVLSAGMGGAFGGLNPFGTAFQVGAGVVGAATANYYGMDASRGYMVGELAGGIVGGGIDDVLRAASKGAKFGGALKHAAGMVGYQAGGATIGAAIGYQQGGFDGALMGANFGSMAGGIGGAAFNKCFVAGTPVFIPSIPNDRLATSLLVEAVGQDIADAGWRLPIYVSGVLVGVGAYALAETYAAVVKRKHTQASQQTCEEVFNEDDFWLDDVDVLWGEGGRLTCDVAAVATRSFVDAADQVAREVSEMLRPGRTRFS